MELDIVENFCPNNPNVGFGHGFEFWRLLPDDYAEGTCKFCGGKFKRYVTTSISGAIESQNIAIENVDYFLHMSLEDENINQALVLVLNHFIYSVDPDRRKLVRDKMWQMLSYSITGEENMNLVAEIIKSLENGNVDNFMDSLESFEEFNADILSTVQNQEKSVYSR